MLLIFSSLCYIEERNSNTAGSRSAGSLVRIPEAKAQGPSAAPGLLLSGPAVSPPPSPLPSTTAHCSGFLSTPFPLLLSRAYTRCPSSGDIALPPKSPSPGTLGLRLKVTSQKRSPDLADVIGRLVPVLPLMLGRGPFQHHLTAG